MDRMMMCQGARTIGEFLARHPGGRVTVPRAGVGLVRRRCDVDLEEGLWTGRICVPEPAPCVWPGSATDTGFGAYEDAGNALGPRERAF